MRLSRDDTDHEDKDEVEEDNDVDEEEEKAEEDDDDYNDGLKDERKVESLRPMDQPIYQRGCLFRKLTDFDPPAIFLLKNSEGKLQDLI